MVRTMSHELKYQKYTYLILSINYNQAQAQIKIIAKCINLNAGTQFNKKKITRSIDIL